MSETTNNYMLEWAGYRIRLNQEAYDKMLAGEKTLGPQGRSCIVETRQKDGSWVAIPGVQKFVFEITPTNLASIEVNITPYGTFGK